MPVGFSPRIGLAVFLSVVTVATGFGHRAPSTRAMAYHPDCGRDPGPDRQILRASEVDHYRGSYRQNDDLFRHQEWVSRTSVDRESGITGASLRIGLVNFRIKLRPD